MAVRKGKEGVQREGVAERSEKRINLKKGKVKKKKSMDTLTCIKDADLAQLSN